MLGFLIVGKIVAHHLAYMEVVAQLERQHRVVYLLLLYLIYIFLRAQLVGILMIVGDAPAEHDSFQIQCFADFLAVFVHTACQAQSAVLRMDKHLDAVKDISFGIVRIESFLARNLGIGVVVLHIVVIHNNGECTPHYLFIDHCYNLPFGKDADEFLYLLVRPENIASIRINACE